MTTFEKCLADFRHSAVSMSAILVLTIGFVAPNLAVADEVTDWNHIMLQSLITANTSPLVATRVAAIVEASVFDAVNGIEHRYTPIHVDFSAPSGASRRAAAVQAAYTTLVVLFPTQKTTLDVDLQVSLAEIASGAAAETSQSIARGVQWGQTVANDMIAWRSTDGFVPPPPPFLGGTNIGEWRPTPPDFAAGAAPQFAYMTPWAINSPSQFRPTGPPAVTSDAYTAVFNETKTMGAAVGSPRTADQTELALFWNGNTPEFWNRIAKTISDERNLTLSANARLFALLNITMADAAIACWDAKYTYVFWRPITAITLADLDGNPATDVDPSWIPLLQTVPPGITPNHPEYPSGHSTVSGSAAAVLAKYFGDATPFSIDSEKLPGVLRSFPSFSQAIAEINDARVFGGIHFRTACVTGNAVGQAVASFIMNNAMLPLNGQRLGQISHTHGNGTVQGDGESSTADTL